MTWPNVLAIAASGFFTLAGVAMGAFLQPHFEARRERRRRAEDLRLQSLLQLQDLFNEWVHVIARYRSLQVGAAALGNPSGYYSSPTYRETLEARTRLEPQITALCSRLPDRELEKMVSKPLLEAAIIIAGEYGDDERFERWTENAAVSVPRYIGHSIRSIIETELDSSAR